MNYTKLYIRFRRGDTRAIAFVTYMMTLIAVDDKHTISSIEFHRGMSGVLVIELTVDEKRKVTDSEVATEFGAFTVVEGLGS